MSSTPSTGDATPTRAIAVLALASFASAANLRVCDPLLPQMAAELGVTIGGAAMVVMSFALAYGVFQILVGPLGDARGKLALVVLGSLWAGAATILSAAMPSLGPLALVRVSGAAPGRRRSSPWRSPGSATSCPTSGASRCWRASCPGRSWGSCSARRQAACSAS